MIGLVVALAVAFVLVGCSGQPSPGVFYAAHSYNCCTEVTGNNTWHPGQQLTLQWTAQPRGMTTDDTQHQIVLKLTLTGPYATVDALKQATSQGTRPPGVRTLSAPPLTVNDRTYESPVSALNLPADLAPGYYNLDTGSSSAGNSAGGGAVIMIAP